MIRSSMSRITVRQSKALMMLSLLLLCVPAHAQDKGKGRQEALERTRLTKDIADMESPTRDKWQKPEEVIEALGVKEGDVVADVGAGTGYFTFRLAKKVGETGKVYAVDREEDFLDYIRKKMVKKGVKNIIPVLSTQSGPNLPRSCCDALLLVSTYGELYSPVEFMKNARSTLKPGGRVAIINAKPGQIFPLFEVPEKEVILKMEASGYRFVKKYDFLQYQFFLVFR